MALLAVLVRLPRHRARHAPSLPSYAPMPTLLKRVFAVLLSTALLGCEQLPEEYGERYPLCIVEWRGALATDSSAFNIQACWNGRCTSNISVQVPGIDAGPAREYSDAGCVPTTRGGLPSGCPFMPVEPGPGCGIGQIGNDFSVQACAQSSSDGTYFSVTLNPANTSLPDGGDRFGLTIETADGSSLVEAIGSTSNEVTEGGASCRGALFDLGGARIAG